MTESAYVPPRRRSRSWAGAVIITFLIALVLALAYSVTLGPEHYSRATAERLNGTQTLTLGFPSAGTVTPAEAWSSRPIVTPLLDGLTLFANPAVYFGDSPGVVVASPDGGVEVTIHPLGDAASGADIETLFAEEGQPGAPVRNETLASGLELRHIDTGAEDTGAEDAGDDGAGVKGADVESTAAIDTPAKEAPAPTGLIAIVESPSGSSAPLLLRVRLTGATDHSLADYRPALGELIETITLAHG